MSDPDDRFPLVCIYDDPRTWRREVWKDGKMVASFCWTLFDRPCLEKRNLPFYCPTAPFRPGQLWGEAQAKEPFEGTPTPGGWWRVKNLVAMLEAADSEPKGGE